MHDAAEVEEPLEKKCSASAESGARVQPGKSIPQQPTDMVPRERGVTHLVRVLKDTRVLVKQPEDDEEEHLWRKNKSQKWIG